MNPTSHPEVHFPRSARRALLRRPVLIAVVVAVLVVASGAAAFAGQSPGALGQAAPAAPVAPDLETVLNNVRNWIMGILALLATVFLSVGGVRYLVANGEPGEVGKAKDAFRNAGWGYGLAALAPVAVEILKQIVGG
ncbi:pilin [Frankia tisae]|uniref:pilin n=1 Tax=Frankia tisae TaxID=2950104 RepID=UPI0021BE2988|nr:pilin [Frankia tisae]